MLTLSRRLHPQRIRRTVGAASCVRERVRFVHNELRDTPIVDRYQLRGSSLVAEVRHPVLDMWVLEEMFRFRAYEPPEPVIRALEGLRRPVRILDLGAHVGFFGLFMRGRLDDPAIVSFEPDPRNLPLLKRCVRENGLEHRWRVIEAAAGTADGTTEFQSSFHLSRIAPPADDGLPDIQRGIGSTFPFLRDTAMMGAEQQTVACRDVFPFIAAADLVKIDIEGGEWPILADRRFASTNCTALVLEYHPSYGPGATGGHTVHAALSAAGYQSADAARAPDAGLVWAWKDGGRTS
jgi:FkbM family methyltransferase